VFGAPPVPLVLVLVPALVLVAEAVLVLPTPPLPPCDEEDEEELLDADPPPPLVDEDVVSPPLEQAAVKAVRYASKAAARERGEAGLIIGGDFTTRKAASARSAIPYKATGPASSLWHPAPGTPYHRRLRPRGPLVELTENTIYPDLDRGNHDEITLHP